MHIISDVFKWQRPAQRKQGFVAYPGVGFQWEGDVLTRIPGVRFEPYTVPPPLFREFAELGADREAILDFANRYGDLGTGPNVGLTGHVAQYVGHINGLKKLVRLGDVLQQSKGNYRTAVATIGTELLTRRRFFDGLEVEAELVRGTVHVHFKPANLLAFMYFQFGLALVGKKQMRSCSYCGRWFEVGAGRSDKVACSPSCRVQVHRQRRLRAVELAGKGWSPATIARELGSEAAAVKGWLKSYTISNR
jgi:hypothetical protein